MYVFYHSFTISSTLTNYVEFRLKSESDNYMIVRIDIVYKEYDVYNKIPLDIYNLDSNNAYYLYLEPFEAEVVNIKFIINNMSQKPFSNIYIHEFESRNNFPSLDITNKSISFTTNNTQLTASFTYTIKFYNITKYIALNIKPSININNIIVSYENPINIINLDNDIWKPINNLKKNEINLFFIGVTQCASINISLIINNTDYNPFNYINIYEYEKKNNSYSSYIQKNTKSINKVKSNDYMTPILYTVYSSKSNYLAFSFIPNYDINNGLAKISVSGGSFELFNNTSKYITNLKSENDYFFFIKTKEFDIINLTLSYPITIENPIYYIYYQELSKREGYNNNFQTIQTVSQILNKTHLTILISQNISKESTQYINYKFRSSNNVDNMIAKINIIECLFYMRSFRQSKKIYNLKSNIIYYIQLLAWWDSITVLNLTVNSSRFPFSYIKIYECDGPRQSLSFCERITTLKNYKYTYQNNQYNITIENNNTFDTAYDIFIEIIPKYDINYIYANTEVIFLSKSESKSKSDSKFDVSLLIIIILQVLFLL